MLSKAKRDFLWGLFFFQSPNTFCFFFYIEDQYIVQQERVGQGSSAFSLFPLSISPLVSSPPCAIEKIPRYTSTTAALGFFGIMHEWALLCHAYSV